MKTFNDLEIGDCIYTISRQTLLKFEIKDIVKYPMYVDFIYGESLFEAIYIPKDFLQQNQLCNVFADINAILEYTNENI